MLAKLVCPACKTSIVRDGENWKCPGCQTPFTYNQGILSFLTPEERFNESVYEELQISNWTATARFRLKIRSSPLLSFINLIRIKFSLSGRRDRIFRDEMKPRASRDRLILDLGCGGGRHYFCDYGRVIGVDPVLPLLQMARQIYDEVYQTSGFKLPFADGSFDYVVSSDVLGHISSENKDQLFSEIHRVLKPGGRTVHCSEADATNVWYRFAHRHPDLFHKYFVDKPGHIGLETPTRLRERFIKHGFRQVTFRKLCSTLCEPGSLVAFFDNEYKAKNEWIRMLVEIDRVLAKNGIIRELLNFALEPLARIDDWLSPFDHAPGALIVFEKS
jgi:SAM-dependent methyltransferase